MPELPEVEAYRRLAEAAALGRVITGVEAPDPWFLKGGIAGQDLDAALVGRRLVAARRRGKLLLLDTDGGRTLGLRFGMTGRLVVDGITGVEQLLYTSSRDDPGWDRFALSLTSGAGGLGLASGAGGLGLASGAGGLGLASGAGGLGLASGCDGGRLRVNDPRRLGGVTLDPDEAALGPDALAATAAQLAAALAGSSAPLKARLLDQAHLAGVGNLMADEVLWRAGLSPLRLAGSLAPPEHRRLHRALRSTIRRLIERGGSHLGDLAPHRLAGGACPRDGTRSNVPRWEGAPPGGARPTRCEQQRLRPERP